MMKRWLLPIAVWAALACGDQVNGLLPSHEQAEVVDVSGDVVSRVNGSAIALAEVERLAEATDLSASAALRRLQAERLLSQEARSRGYAQSARTGQAARKAQIQELLKATVETVHVKDAEIEAAYKAHEARFEQPERRRATHVLAQLPADASPAAERAAHEFIMQTIRALQTTDDTAATLRAAEAETSPLFKVVVQELPAAEKQGKFVPEFADALFSVDEPGVVPDPVRTRFGYHAILVREILPAEAQPRSVAFETLRSELSTQHEKRRLDALLSDLREHTRVRFADDAHKLLAALDF